jgi:hypothetical protein
MSTSDSSARSRAQGGEVSVDRQRPAKSARRFYRSVRASARL